MRHCIDESKNNKCVKKILWISSKRYLVTMHAKVPNLSWFLIRMCRERTTRSRHVSGGQKSIIIVSEYHSEEKEFHEGKHWKVMITIIILSCFTCDFDRCVGGNEMCGQRVPGNWSGLEHRTIGMVICGRIVSIPHNRRRCLADSRLTTTAAVRHTD